MWPFGRKAEVRQRSEGGYTDLLLTAQTLQAEGTARTDFSGLSSLEGAARFYRSAFQTAEVSGDPTGMLTPSILGHAAQQLIRRGQALFEIARVDGRFKLVSVGQWWPYGRGPEENWYFQTHTYGPSGTQNLSLLWDDCVFLRYSYSPLTPWVGIGPLQSAIRTGVLAAKLESALGDEAGAAVAMVMPWPERSLPEGQDEPEFDPVQILTDQLAKLKGALALVPTTAGGHGDRSSAPQTDWRQQRLGPVYTAEQVELRAAVNTAIFSACGIPAALVDPTAASANREAWRQFAFGSVMPLARLVEEEFSAKLDKPVKLGFDRLMASDVQARGRFVQSLVAAGETLENAMRLAMLLDD